MRVNSLLKLVIVHVVLLVANIALATQWIQGIRSNSLKDKLQIVIDLQQQSDFTAFALSNPVRLVVDVTGRPKTGFSNGLSFKNRGVSSVRTGMRDEEQMRVVLDLVKDFQWKAYHLKPSGNRSHRVVIDIIDYPSASGAAHTESQHNNHNATVASASAPSPKSTTPELTLESLSSANEQKPFEPVIKEASEVLGLESLPKTTPKPAVVATTAAKSTPTKKTNKAPKPTTTVVSKTAPLKKTETVAPTKPPPPRIKAHKDILVMIDPGHGGKDSGAVGKHGTQEKRIVLQIAKRLKKRIDQISGMRAILTRSTDRYITLRGRLAMASKHQPDLFVSIHADAARNRSASGSSIYILSNHGASSKTAKWIAERENAVDAKFGNNLGDFSSDISNVLLGMQQDITIESSHTAAQKTLRQLKGIGKLHKRRVERAGFAVLKASKIPSMLVETAFISNPQEEKKLRKASYQKKLADSIAKGIEQYFKSQGLL